MSRSRQVTINLECQGSEYHSQEEIKGSVRGRCVTLFIRHDGGWPHMTAKQALRLADWLHDAVDEVEARSKTPAAAGAVKLTPGADPNGEKT